MPKAWLRVCCSVAAIASSSVTATAQRPDTVARAGATVKMWSKRMSWSAQTGQVVSWVNRDTMIVAAKIVVMGKGRTNRYQIPVWELDTLQVLVRPAGSRSKVERSLLWGSVLGAAAGALVGYVSLASDQCGQAKVGPCTVGEFATGGSFFALIGGLLGLAAGALVSAIGNFADDGSWATVAVERPSG